MDLFEPIKYHASCHGQGFVAVAQPGVSGDKCRKVGFQIYPVDSCQPQSGTCI